jgi:four helix bundle protein
MQHTQERQFGFERLIAWQYAIEAVERADEIVRGLPRPYAELADQLRRASLSIICNLAEGVGKDMGKDQLRFFRIARGSAYESAALVEAAARLRLVSGEQRSRVREPLLSTAALLTRLLRSQYASP